MTQKGKLLKKISEKKTRINLSTSFHCFRVPGCLGIVEKNYWFLIY